MSIIKLSDVADPDEIKEAKLSVRDRKGRPVKVDVTYYPNRLTTEDGDEVETIAGDGDDADREDKPLAPAYDVMFCRIVHGWNVYGPLRRPEGEVVVRDGEPVPLEPHITQYVPLWLKQGIQDGIVAVEFPDPKASTHSRGG